MVARNPLIRKKEKSYTTPMKNQSAGILDDYAVRKVINTKEGTIEKVPVNGNDIVNKDYADGLAGVGGDLVGDSINIGGGEMEHTVNGVTVGSLAEFHSEGVANPAGVTVHNHGDTDAIGTEITLLRSRGTHASPTGVTDNTVIGRLSALPYDGTDHNIGGQIAFVIDGTPGTDDSPTEIVFSNTADGDNTPTENMAIKPDGTIDVKGNDIIDISSLKSAEGDAEIDLEAAEDVFHVKPGASAGNNYVIVKSASDDAENPQVYPSANGEGQLGLTGSRWDKVYTDEITVTNNIVVGGTVDGIDIATDVAANTADSHAQDTDTALGSGCVAADHGTAATDQVVNVSYGTGSPPTANTTTIGSLFVKYTA